MASRRSQVSQLDPIRSVTPVARGVDTFVLTKPRPVDESALQVLDALSQLSPTLANLGQKGRDIKEKQRLEALEQRQKLEKSELTTLFTRDPIQFMADLKDGKFRGMLDVSQNLAGEYAGKNLARAFGSDLIQEYYQSEEMLNSQDENAMLFFEADFRNKFIDLNAEIFSLPGAAEGFASTFRQYTSQLDSVHMSTARENRVNSQTQGFKTNVYTILDRFDSGTLTEESFKTRIRQAQDDYMVGFGFKPGQANLATLKAIHDYVTSGITDFETGREILQLAQTIETSPGSYLAKTTEGRVLLAEAATKIDEMERQAEKRMNDQFNERKSRVTNYWQGILEKYMKQYSTNDAMLEALDIETIFAQEEIDDKFIKELDIYFPQWRRYFEDQKNFFMKEAQEVESQDIIEMQIELGKYTNREGAVAKINQWQNNGRLKNNVGVYNSLMVIANGIKDIPPDKEKDWTKDTTFKQMYKELSGSEIDSGFSPFTPTDPRHKYLIEFRTDFFRLFYKPEYVEGTFTQKFELLNPIFERYLQLIQNANTQN